MKKTGRENIENSQGSVIMHRNILVKGETCILYHREFLFYGYSTALNKITGHIVLFHILDSLCTDRYGLSE